MSHAGQSIGIPVDSCSLHQNGHCATCSDEALCVQVLSVDEQAGLALVALNEYTEQVDISLINTVAPGDLLLVHGGVALERLEEPHHEQPGRL